jgi:hypothetical protein
VKILDVVSEYPCPRAAKLSLALGRNDLLARRPPMGLSDAYARKTIRPDLDAKYIKSFVAESDADVIQIHGEMYSGWLAEAVREGAGNRPVVLNAHDLTAARPSLTPDPYEFLLYEVADGIIYVTDKQRTDTEELYDSKPSILVPNFQSSTCFIDKTPLPYLGGLVYEGGLDKRGQHGAWRDLSPIADSVELHIYPADPNVDYGTIHGIETDYRVLSHRLAQHDWGFTGSPTPHPAWQHAFPNKVADYWAAGIPFVALHTPILSEYADMGMGICISSIDELKRLPDPRPYRKRVLAQRGQFTMEAQADKVREFIRGLSC